MIEAVPLSGFRSFLDSYAFLGLAHCQPHLLRHQRLTYAVRKVTHVAYVADSFL